MLDEATVVSVATDPEAPSSARLVVQTLVQTLQGRAGEEGEEIEVRTGPFVEAELPDFGAPAAKNANENQKQKSGKKSKTSKTSFSLLLNDLELSLPSLASLASSSVFPIIPSRHFSDVQLSLSTVGGGIGLHVDNYGVFLCQTAGKKTWTVETETLSREQEELRTLPDTELRLLSKDANVGTFTATLQPLDILYLPPRFPHHGVAASPSCSTLSIGTRAPAIEELAAAAAEAAGTAEFSGEVVCPSPAPLKEGESGGFISEEEREGAREAVRRALLAALDGEAGRARFDDEYAKAATRSEILPEALAEMEEEERESRGVWGDAERAVDAVVGGKDGGGEGCGAYPALYRSEGVKFGYTEVGLYAGGLKWVFDGEEERRLAVVVCDRERVDRMVLVEERGIKVEGRARDMLVWLVEESLLSGSDVDCEADTDAGKY